MTHYAMHVNTFNVFVFLQAYEEAQKRLKMAEDDKKIMVDKLFWGIKTKN